MSKKLLKIKEIDPKKAIQDKESKQAVVSQERFLQQITIQSIDRIFTPDKTTLLHDRFWDFNDNSQKNNKDIKSTNLPSILLHSPFILRYINSKSTSNDIFEQCINGIIQYGQIIQERDIAFAIAGELKEAILKFKTKKQISQFCVKLYTKYSFLYRNINHYLRSADFMNKEGSEYCSDQSWDEVKHLMPFCFILNQYLIENCKQKAFKGTVFRGAQLTEQMIEQYKKYVGQQRQWNGFTSTTKNKSVAKRFGNTLFQINLGCDSGNWLQSGVEISHISEYFEEQEVLLRSGIQIMILRLSNEEDKAMIRIECIDISP